VKTTYSKLNAFTTLQQTFTEATWFYWCIYNGTKD